mgnify:CR=1 FL=1
MKRLFSILLVAILMVSILPVAGSATETMETIYYDNGSYMTIEVMYSPVRATWSITGNKQYTYYNSNSVSQWKAVLTGTFTYTGSSSSCTASSVNVTIYDSSWYVISKSASKNGNTATGAATIGEKVNGVTVTKVPVNLTLSCDANGNLS